MARRLALFIILMFAVGCASITHKYTEDGKLREVSVRRTPSVLGAVFGEPLITPGEERIRDSLAEKNLSRARVDDSRAHINDEIANNTAVAVHKGPETVRSLADLRSSNAPDEGQVSAYAGGSGAYSRADSYVSRIAQYYRRGGF